MTRKRPQAQTAPIAGVVLDAEDADQAHAIWRQVNTIKKLSDRVVGIGPFGIGLDGVLAWIPPANAIYAAGAAGFLMLQGVRAGASGPTLVKMLGFLAADTASSGVPVVGWAFDTLFPGHLMAASALQKDIEARHGPPPEEFTRRQTRWGRKR